VEALSEGSGRGSRFVVTLRSARGAEALAKAPAGLEAGSA
jgi:hypothetical protein